MTQTREELEAQAITAWINLMELDLAAEVPAAAHVEHLAAAEGRPGEDFGRLVAGYVQRGLDGDFDVVSRDWVVQAYYVAHRLDGDGHKLAEMLALGAPPLVKSDSTFLAGHCNGSQFDGQELVADRYLAVATAAGVNVKGAVYKSGLARFPGDPEAWVRGRGDVQKVVEARGWGCQGDVTVKARDDVEPPADVDVAPDLVDRRVEQKLAANPDLARADQAELRDAAFQEIKPHWSKT